MLIQWRSRGTNRRASQSVQQAQCPRAVREPVPRASAGRLQHTAARGAQRACRERSPSSRSQSLGLPPQFDVAERELEPAGDCCQRVSCLRLSECSIQGDCVNMAVKGCFVGGGVAITKHLGAKKNVLSEASSASPSHRKVHPTGPPHTNDLRGAFKNKLARKEKKVRRL